MAGKESGLNEFMLRAKIAIEDGRTEEGIEELRRAIYESVKLSQPEGRNNVEQILKMAHEYDVFTEIEDSLQEGNLRKHFFGG